jgi:predicted transcriptional regulator
VAGDGRWSREQASPDARAQRRRGRCASAISVRLDSEALRALAQLESTGLTRSGAIRRAILDSAARMHRQAAIAAEVAALEADEGDRREMLEVADFMEGMRATG